MLKSITKFTGIVALLAFIFFGCCEQCKDGIETNMRSHRVCETGKSFFEIFAFEFYFFGKDKQLTIAKYVNGSREITEFSDPDMKINSLADIIGYGVLQYGYNKFYVTRSCLNAIGKVVDNYPACATTSIASTECRVSCSAYDIANLGLRARNPEIQPTHFNAMESVYEVVPKLDSNATINIHVEKPVRSLPIPTEPLVYPTDK